MFTISQQSHLAKEQAGDQALAILYGYIPGTDLNFERAAKLREKAVSSSSYLPPATSDAARFHGQRAGMARI